MTEKFYFNDKENTELTDRIFELISNAKRYIKTGNFFFKDPKLNKALLKAAERGVAIFILSNLTGCENRGYVKTNSKVETAPHIPHLHELHRSGVHVHLCNDLHAKFILCDGEVALIMSANYTPDSLYGNPENGIDIFGSELKDLEYVFDKLYMHPDTILSEDGQRYRYLKKSVHLPVNTFDAIGNSSRLLLTAGSEENSNLRNCSHTSIYNKIVELVNESIEAVLLVSWSYNQINKLPELKKAIANAIKRGVTISILYGTKGTEKQIKRTEEQLKVLLNTDCLDNKCAPFTNNHAKCLITEKTGIMFTANIDGHRGLLSGFELGCVLTEEQREYSINRINQIINNG